MKILKAYNERHMAEAADTLRDGGVVVLPTDTIYALAVDARNHRAIERLCRIKGIDPERQQLSLLCADLSQAAEYVRIDNGAFRTLRHYLPGPFTFVLPVALRLPKMLKNRRTIGLRVPNCDAALALARAIDGPLFCASATIDDPDELAEPESIAMHYAALADVLVDGGTGGTTGSTIVDLTDSSDPVVIRDGAAPFEG